MDLKRNGTHWWVKSQLYSVTNPFLTPCEYPMEKVVTGKVSDNFSIRSNLFKIRSSSSDSRRLKWEYMQDRLSILFIKNTCSVFGLSLIYSTGGKAHGKCHIVTIATLWHFETKITVAKSTVREIDLDLLLGRLIKGTQSVHIFLLLAKRIELMIVSNNLIMLGKFQWKWINTPPPPKSTLSQHEKSDIWHLWNFLGDYTS